MPTIRVRVAKTIQERQYEPFTLEVEQTLDLDFYTQDAIGEETERLTDRLTAFVDKEISLRRRPK